MISQGYAELGYQQLTGISSATPLTVPPGANFALIQAEAQNVRWRDDGVAPTTTVGMLMLTTDKAMEYSGPLGSLKLIAATAGAIVNVSYYKSSG